MNSLIESLSVIPTATLTLLGLSFYLMLVLRVFGALSAVNKDLRIDHALKAQDHSWKWAEKEDWQYEVLEILYPDPDEDVTVNSTTQHDFLFIDLQEVLDKESVRLSDELYRATNAWITKKLAEVPEPQHLHQN